MTPAADELLAVEGLSKHFPVARGVLGKTIAHVRAVDDVSFGLGRGETLGLVGESGCGKTTTGRALLRLIEPSAGRVRFDGVELTGLSQGELRPYRRRMQIVFQDPYGSLNPRMRVIDLLGEGLERHGVATGASVEREVRALLARVGLSGSWVHRYPHEFSGGQRQRLGIARAVAVQPDLIVCDEAVSALDVSVQAQIINLLIDLRRELNLAYLFIAHDLSVVRHISDRVAVMYLGRIVELAPSAGLFERPAHPYTRALLSAVPLPDPRRRQRRVVLSGDVPTPLSPPSGCHFHPRCPAALGRCGEVAPPLIPLDGGRRSVRCVHAEGLEGVDDWYTVLEARLREAEAGGPRRAPARGGGDAALIAAGAGADVSRGAEAHAASVQASEQEEAPRVVPARRDAGATLPRADGAAGGLARTGGAGQGVALAQPTPRADEHASEGQPGRLPGGALGVGRAERPEAGAGRASEALDSVVALAAVVAGVVLTSAGRGGWGLLLIAGAGTALAWRSPGWVDATVRARLWPVLGAFWLGALLLSFSLEPRRRALAVGGELAALRAAIEGFRGNVGRLPAELGELRWRTVERFGRGTPRDPWGRPYRYEPSAAGDGYELSSDGADGVPSADDLR